MDTLLQTLRGIGPFRLGVMAAVAAGIVAFFIYLTSRFATPDMALLYADLANQDSGQIVSRLEQMGVEYRLGRDGGQIYVPGDQVARLRLTMAEQGLPTGGSIGYEIFDRSDGLGTTSFVQNMNRLRALEGELARTIRSLSGVRSARVHLVLPQRELFSRDRQEPSAAIVLMMQGSQRLADSEVSAIQHLVAAAVPGLEPTAISVVDNHGTLLARGGEEGDVAGTASTAEEMRRDYENRLSREIEELIGRTVGFGNVRASVTAELDFDRVTENSETYDPDGQVVRSTQTVEESSAASDGDPNAVTVGNNLPDAGLPALGGAGGSQNQATRTEETVNYEISRTVRTHVREAGVVRRLSVAVMVNGTTGTNDAGESTYEPRSEEEMERLTAIVRSAVGIDDERGDRLEVVNLQFADLSTDTGELAGTLLFGFDKATLMRSAELLVLGLLAVLVLLLVVRPLVARLLEASSNAALSDEGNLIGARPGGRMALPGPGGQGAAIAQRLNDQGELEPEHNVAAEIEQMIDINKVEGRVRASSVKKIGEIVEKHPEEAVAIIRSWLYQET